MRVILIAAGVAALVLRFPHPVIWLLERLWPDIRWRQATTSRHVSLTVDDGPDPVFTRQLLGVLRQRNIAATFFVVGERVRRYPDVMEEICRDGHEIANHSNTWRRTIGLGVREFERDLLEAEAALQAYPRFRKLFRPAGVMIRRSHLPVLHRLGYECVLGSAYAFDPYRPPAGFISWTIAQALRPGAIVVVHDSGGDRTNTIRAIPAILDAAHSRRLTFVPLTVLLGLR